MEIELLNVSMSTKEIVGYVKSIYRSALLDLGRSPDSHIYELGEQDFYLSKEQERSRKKLEEIALFYASLPKFEGEIFINDCLESGRHYRYWYLGGAGAKNYQRSKKNLFLKLREAF